MQRLSLCLIFIIVACSKPPAVAPPTRQTLWIDAATHSDTIITNLNNQPPLFTMQKTIGSCQQIQALHMDIAL